MMKNITNGVKILLKIFLLTIGVAYIGINAGIFLYAILSRLNVIE